MTRPVPALVLRRVPPERLHLVHALAPEAPGGPDDADGTWWELVDVASEPDRPATGVALTRTDAAGVARVVVLAAVGTADADPLPLLVLELVATLRRSEATAVEIRCRRQDVLARLRTEDVDVTGDTVLVRL